MNVARPHNSTRYEEILIHIHYIYPLVLFVFFLVSLTWWSIATSQSSGPTPPPVNGVYQNGKKKNNSKAKGKGKRRASVHVDVADFEERKPGFWARFAARFPDGGAANKSLGNERKLTPLRKAVLNWLLVGVIATFVANSANVVLHALTKSGWWCGKDYVISTVSLLFIYALLLISQLDGHLSPTLPHLLSWTVGLIGEGLLLATNILIYSENEDRKNRSPIKDVPFSNTGFDYHNIRWGSWSIINLTIDVLRIFLLVVLIGLYLVLVVFRSPASEPEDAEETSPLLDSSASSTAGEADYGSIPAHTKHGASEPSSTNASAGWGRRAVLGKQSWWEYLRGYTIFFPYLWPSKSRRLQLMMILCFILVILQRGVNVLVPRQLGKITNILSGENGEPPKLPWLQILLYIIYRFLQGNMGVLGALRSTLWIPIGQYSYQALSTSAFEHVHSLSLDFHLGKKTGEVLSALSKGNAINTFLEQVSFQVVPMLVDLGVAVAYFWVSYDTYYALIVAIVTFWYLYITVRMAQWRANIRREMVNKSREEDAVKNDSMIAYETVKYFNAEGYEFSRYRAAVNAYQRAEYKVLLSLNVMNVTQNIVFTLGLVVACFLSAWQVSMGQIDVGKFVAMLAYLAQLQQPLNFFGTFYRSIQSSMINSERMLELFKEQPTVVDSPNAEKLTDCTGEIEFKNVHFAYDERKPALKGLSFTCAPGTTTAFVGESGGGKTTILRLLFRFYNIQSGSIEVDGKDVRDITIDSLRENIGVVPQDTVLFNETIMYNLKYANPKATDEMVFEACRAASIHDKILSFPDGYNTKVGERGLRLSGGEKQRVAIARTILKNPKIILLDEATAALDSETEQYIQAALKELTKGRTTLVIAHRLSTITNANQILCIHEGQVAESGTHDELLARHGRYAMMWNKQIRAEKRKAKVAQIEEDLESDTPSIAPTPSVRTQTHSAPSFSIMEEPTLEAEAPTGEEEEEMLPEEAVMELPLEQNTAGAGPSTIVPNPEEIPKTLSVRIEDPISIPPTPSGAETPGRDSVASAPASPAASPAPPSRTPSGRTRTKSLSLRDGLRRSESGSSAGGSTSPKWSTKGLRKALGRKGTVLKKKEGPPGSSSAGGAAGSASGSPSPGPGATSAGGAAGGEEAA